MKRTRFIRVPPAGCINDVCDVEAMGHHLTSSRGHESLHRLRPLLGLFCRRDQFLWPFGRDVAGRPDQERESLPRACVLDLFVELPRFSGEIPAHIEQDQVIEIWSPENTRCTETICGINLDAVSAYNARSYVAGGLVTVNKKNFLAGKKQAATKWWEIHSTLPKTRAPFGTS